METKSNRKGSILVEQAYAQGKMLDSSGWFGVLPRGITPCDIDHVFDNNGHMIFLEITSQWRTWEEFKEHCFGQWSVYKSLVIFGQSRHVSVLWFHAIPINVQINTFRDCESFSVMWMQCHDDRKRMTVSPAVGGDKWPGFVKLWFSDRAKLYERLGEMDSECPIPSMNGDD